MFIANAQSNEGKMLVIGLDDDNIKHLQNDEPFSKELGEIIPELDGWRLIILGPEDTVRFIAQTEPN